MPALLRGEWVKFNLRLKWIMFIKRDQENMYNPLRKLIHSFAMEVKQTSKETGEVIESIPTFCEAIEIHMQPELYKEWFPKDEAPRSQT